MLGSPVCSTCRSVSTTRIGSPACRRPRACCAGAVATEAELRLLVHLDLGDHPAGRGIQPGEVDAGCLADQAASSVAADEVLRSERRVVGQLDIDAGVVLREAHHLAATKDRNPELSDPVGQDALEVALPQREHVVVAGGEVADVQGDQGEPVRRDDLPRREEPFRDATLIEHLDGAGVQTPGSRSVEILTGASFDDDDVDPRQRQLARQHQPGRTASGDHHRMLGHRCHSPFGRAGSRKIGTSAPKLNHPCRPLARRTPRRTPPRRRRRRRPRRRDAGLVDLRFDEPVDHAQRVIHLLACDARRRSTLGAPRRAKRQRPAERRLAPSTHPSADGGRRTGGLVWGRGGVGGGRREGTVHPSPSARRRTDHLRAACRARTGVLARVPRQREERAAGASRSTSDRTLTFG